MSDEVWVGPDEPTDPETELWYDTDAEPGAAAMMAAVMSAEGPYTWNADVPMARGVQPPFIDTGTAATDNDLPSQATELYVACVDVNGIDHEPVMAAMRPGDAVLLYNDDDLRLYHRFRIVAAGVEADQVYTFPVATIAGSPVGTEPPTGTRVGVAFQFTAESEGGGTPGPQGEPGPHGAQGAVGPQGPLPTVTFPAPLGAKTIRMATGVGTYTTDASGNGTIPVGLDALDPAAAVIMNVAADNPNLALFTGLSTSRTAITFTGHQISNYNLARSTAIPIRWLVVDPLP